MFVRKCYTGGDKANYTAKSKLIKYTVTITCYFSLFLAKRNNIQVCRYKHNHNVSTFLPFQKTALKSTVIPNWNTKTFVKKCYKGGNKANYTTKSKSNKYTVTITCYFSHNLVRMSPV